MGAERDCLATFRGHTSAGRAKLETDYLLFRGDFLVKLPFPDITSVNVAGGALQLESGAETLSLELGPDAAKWAVRIRSPKSRIEKLGMKPGARVSVLGLADPVFMAELERVGGPCVDAAAFVERSRLLCRRVGPGPDAVRAPPHLAAARRCNLGDPSQGRPDASESATMKAGKAAGLVDVKVVRFSETHTAEKYVRRKR